MPPLVFISAARVLSFVLPVAIPLAVHRGEEGQGFRLRAEKSVLTDHRVEHDVWEVAEPSREVLAIVEEVLADYADVYMLEETTKEKVDL